MECLPVIVLVLGLAALLAWAFRLARKAGGTSPPLAHRWQKGVDVLGDDVDSGDDSAGSLMGEAVPDVGVKVLAAGDFGFVASSGNSLETLRKGDQLGMVADVQQEIKAVCALLAQKDGNKEDFFTMFELIRQKYPKTSGREAALELRPFIRERVPFHLSDEELDNLWG